jgi:hypothetical protein
MRAVFDAHGADIATEVLAIDVAEGTPDTGTLETELPVRVAIQRV